MSKKNIYHWYYWGHSLDKFGCIDTKFAHGVAEGNVFPFCEKSKETWIIDFKKISEEQYREIRNSFGSDKSK